MESIDTKVALVEDVNICHGRAHQLSQPSKLERELQFSLYHFNLILKPYLTPNADLLLHRPRRS